MSRHTVAKMMSSPSSATICLATFARTTPSRVRSSGTVLLARSWKAGTISAAMRPRTIRTIKPRLQVVLFQPHGILAHRPTCWELQGHIFRPLRASCPYQPAGGGSRGRGHAAGVTRRRPILSKERIDKSGDDSPHDGRDDVDPQARPIAGAERGAARA